MVAFAGLGLHHLTGSAVWDGVASLTIGLLLAVVAYSLGRTNLRLLIGSQAEPGTVRGIHRILAEAPEIEPWWTCRPC